jgi:hypothetical protein
MISHTLEEARDPRSILFAVNGPGNRRTGGLDDERDEPHRFGRRSA